MIEVLSRVLFGVLKGASFSVSFSAVSWWCFFLFSNFLFYHVIHLTKSVSGYFWTYRLPWLCFVSSASISARTAFTLHRFTLYPLPFTFFLLPNSPHGECFSPITTKSKCPVSIRDISKSHHSNYTNRYIPDRGHHPGTFIRANTTAIFVIRDISDVMNSIFYFPMPSIQFQ